jgi:UDP-GlcNAc:undecaprenyl-phosphate GlcNAc-1-phosphate transferase
MTLYKAIEIFLLAGVLALGMGRLCMALALRMRWVDRPGHRKIHKRPVPYLGGVALFLALGTTVFGLALYQRNGIGGLDGFSLLSLLACSWPALAAVALGLWDDLFDLRARYKFLGQAMVALVFSQFAYRFTVLHIPGFSAFVMEPEIAVLVTAFFIVAIANGFNMIDGSDALCLGASMVSFAMVAVVAQVQGQPLLVLLGTAAAGACLGMLYWNRPSARIYLGDAGSQGLGFLAACLIVALGKGEPGQFIVDLAPDPSRPWFPYKIVVAFLLVAWPAFEVLLTVARRAIQGRGLGRADQGHFHHRLARLGLGPAAIAATAMAMNLYCGLIVLAFLVGLKGLAVLLMLPLAALLGLGLQKLGYLKFFRRNWLDDRRPHFAVASHFAAMQSAKLKLARNCDEVLILVEQICHEFGVLACRVNLTDVDGTRRAWAWGASPAFLSSRVVRDRVRVIATRNHASWSVDAHDEREPELSMNLRVVLVEFMRTALEHAGELDRDNTVLFSDRQDPYLAVERRAGERKFSVMSIRGLKQRL